MNFLEDRDKMIDFFNMERGMFLESYSYLSESDYTETAKTICEKVKFNNYKYYDCENCEGMELGNIVYAAMMYEWLNK